MLNKDALYLAWKDINKNSATGIDKETAREFVKNLDANIEELVEELKSKRYKAKCYVVEADIRNFFGNIDHQ